MLEFLFMKTCHLMMEIYWDALPNWAKWNHLRVIGLMPISKYAANELKAVQRCFLPYQHTKSTTMYCKTFIAVLYGWIIRNFLWMLLHRCSIDWDIITLYIANDIFTVHSKHNSKIILYQVSFSVSNHNQAMFIRYGCIFCI